MFHNPGGDWYNWLGVVVPSYNVVKRFSVLISVVYCIDVFWCFKACRTFLRRCASQRWIVLLTRPAWLTAEFLWQLLAILWATLLEFHKHRTPSFTNDGELFLISWALVQLRFLMKKLHHLSYPLWTSHISRDSYRINFTSTHNVALDT